MIWIILLILSPMLSGLSYGQSLTGDINGDGRVDEADLDRGTEIVLGRLPTASENELAAADLDRDGRVTVKDLVLIANTIGGQNRPPVADGSASPDSGLVGVDIQLDGGMSLDLDGD
ncbi:MAG: dockerin type I repeat-containing protein, partial [Candidatus Latescibacteria bacterium]|nr:dockerin type I repeat-containing protein [Candidatus Latescibacterota bacterium]